MWAFGSEGVGILLRVHLYEYRMISKKVLFFVCFLSIHFSFTFFSFLSFHCVRYDTCEFTEVFFPR